MNYYFVYYLAFVLAAYVLQRPPLILGIVLFFVLRPFLPDPVVLLRTWGQIRSLSRQVETNPANIIARRDLASLWLERLRPGKALALLEEADKRDPNNAEILYLMGVAKFRSGDPEGALSPLVKAVDIDPRVRFGEPYLIAGQALLKLDRHEEAEDALERYVRVNSSSVQGLYLLGKARSARGDREGAAKTFTEARTTFWQLPGFKKRGQTGWWLKSVLASILS
ncbi:MAG: tetratricopeptide repeat protein [Polyangiaceae bacterium]|nr:tetratricopeptide repeat protein [Polyangiaceae bacterium]NUQ76189.1 tetratricopeptide repeat protein [Polyangiaceae bacterium]